LLQALYIPTKSFILKKEDNKKQEYSFMLDMNRLNNKNVDCTTIKDIGYGYLTEVESIKTVTDVKEVYDIAVENEQNYVTTSGLIHNSSGGSLVAYLLGITEIDPIPNGLLFERFYSIDRSAGETPSLPDIDTDFPKDKREYVVKYIEEKYGKDKVVHISNFATLKGSGALTEVLKAHDIFDHNMIKSITKRIPGQDKVIDRMEEEGEDSLIRFVLRFMPDVLKILGSIEGDKIVGEYAYHLEQAIRLEGVIRNTGVHASGILISNEPVEDICPLAIDNDCERKIAGVEMKAAEKLGLVKVDILGLKCLDKLMEIQKLLLGISEDQ
jgi:DNA polymerase-3 subunit alpha